MDIEVTFKDKDIVISKGITIPIPDNITTFAARKLLLQEIVHKLYHYVLRELTLHLEQKKVIRDSGW